VLRGLGVGIVSAISRRLRVTRAEGAEEAETDLNAECAEAAKSSWFLERSLGVLRGLRV